MDLLEHIERAADRLIIGGVQPPGPAPLGEQADHRFQIAFHLRRHVGAGDAEILEIGGRIDQHLARAVMAISIVAVPRLDLRRPGGEVLQLLLRLLREEIIGDAQCQLAILVQLVDDGIVIGIILRASARIDHAGDAQAVELAHEMLGAVQLVVRRQLGPLGQRRIQDRRIGLRQQQAGGIALRIADDLTARRVGRVLAIADRAQRRRVQQSAIIEVQDEDRRFGRRGVDLVQCRQPLFGELMLGKAADHAHPLRRRRIFRLALQHRHGLGQARHAFPAQLHIIVEPAADHMDVAVDQAGDRAPTLGVDHLRVRRGGGAHRRFGSDRQESAVADGDGLRHRIFPVQRRHLGVDEDQVLGRHGEALRSGQERGGGGAGERLAASDHGAGSVERANSERARGERGRAGSPAALSSG